MVRRSSNGRLRAEGRVSCRLRQFSGGCRKFFGNNLPCKINVRAPVEFDPYDGKSRSGGRAYAAYPGSSVYGSFNREGDQLFHFFRRHAVGLRHDYDGRGVQVRKYVYFGVDGAVNAGHEEQGGCDQDEKPVL